MMRCQRPTLLSAYAAACQDRKALQCWYRLAAIQSHRHCFFCIRVTHVNSTAGCRSRRRQVPLVYVGMPTRGQVEVEGAEFGVA